MQNRKWKFCYMRYADILENSIPTEKTIVKLGKLLVPLLLLNAATGTSAAAATTAATAAASAHAVY